MGAAFRDSLPMALALAVNPLPAIAIVLILSTARARTNGTAFVAGWLTALGGIGGVMLVLADVAHASEGGSPAPWVSWTKVVLGLALLGVAFRQIAGARRGAGKAEPAWMAKVEVITAPKAYALALGLGGVNPKNVLLVAGGVAAIAESETSGAMQAAVLAAFVLIGSAGVLIPCGISLAAGHRSPELLGHLRSWLSRHSARIVAAICLVIGLVLLAEGIGSLVS